MLRKFDVKKKNRLHLQIYLIRDPNLGAKKEKHIVKKKKIAPSKIGLQRIQSRKNCPLLFMILNSLNAL